MRSRENVDEKVANNKGLRMCTMSTVVLYYGGEFEGISSSKEIAFDIIMACGLLICRYCHQSLCHLYL